LEQGILKLSLDKGNKLKEGDGGLPREKVWCVWGKKKKKKGESARKDLVLMCGEVFMERVCARIKHGRRLCVASTYNNAFGFLVQLIVPPKSTIGLVSKFNQY
jgi:hypothetical protein